MTINDAMLDCVHITLFII